MAQKPKKSITSSLEEPQINPTSGKSKSKEPNTDIQVTTSAIGGNTQVKDPEKNK